MIDKSLNHGRIVIKDFFIYNSPYTNVLDIGAGKGSDLLLAHEIHDKCNKYALEYYPPNVSHLDSLGIKVSMLDIEKETFPYDKEYFDIIIANQILEHTKNIFWIFHEISRTLELGGHCIVGVPNLSSLHNRLLLLFGKQPTSIHLWGPHIRGFTKQGLLLFLNNCWNGGYECVQFAGSNFYPFSPYFAQKFARIFPNSAVSIFFNLKKTKIYKNQFIEYLEQNPQETNFFVG